LDGTLLDVRLKYLKIYEAGLGISIANAGFFWDLKRSGACDEEICDFMEIKSDLNGFKKFKRDNIELEQYLKFDKLIDGVAAHLGKLASQVPLCILTIRKNRTNLIDQLERLGIGHYFKKIISPSSELFELPGCEQKSALLADLFPGIQGYMIGDSEADIGCAREMNLGAISVLSGIRNFSYLKQLGPDKIVADLTKFQIVTDERPFRND